MTGNLLAPLTLAIDALLAAALAVALGMVFLLEPPAEKPKPIAITEPEVVVPEAPPARKQLRLAVVPETAEFDDMGRLLDTLGEAYVYRRAAFDDLLDPEKLKRYDIVFVTCSGFPENWLGAASGGQLRGGTLRGPNPETFAKAKATLREFVRNGGTLYASDLHFNLVAECFPEFVDQSLMARGRAQTVRAQVVDPGLRDDIGREIELAFDQEGWAAAAFAAVGMTSYLKGTFRTIDGSEREAPLLVKLPFEQGNVVFTSFHNEKQNSEKEKQLLKYLVFSAVTAGVDAEAGRQMASGGFSATKKNLFSASSEAEAVSQTYESTAVADLQFVLAFPEQGATLEFAVTGPDGMTVKKTGSATITIDVPAAAVGTWTYSIKAIKVPSANFPFTVTVGKKK